MNKLYFTPKSEEDALREFGENVIEFKDEENCQKMLRMLADMGFSQKQAPQIASKQQTAGR